jgi:hypothetical protein
MCRSRERSSLAEAREAEIETDAIYQRENQDNNLEEQKATF